MRCRGCQGTGRVSPRIAFAGICSQCWGSGDEPSAPAWGPDPMSHDFIGVAEHSDDDECTYREDGTDATYCGLPEAEHHLAEECAACDTPLDECPMPVAGCCDDCTHGANYSGSKPTERESAMSDAHQTLPAEDEPLTDEEKLIRACDWSDYRKAYGVAADPDQLRREHSLFCAGWDAGRRSGWDTNHTDGSTK